MQMTVVKVKAETSKKKYDGVDFDAKWPTSAVRTAKKKSTPTLQATRLKTQMTKTTTIYWARETLSNDSQ